MNFHLQMQKRYYFFCVLLALIISVFIALLLVHNTLGFFILFITMSITIASMVKAITSHTIIEIESHGIIFHHPLGLIREINFENIKNIQSTTKGFSIFALSHEKVFLTWEKECKTFHLIFSPKDSFLFVNTIHTRIT